MVWTVGRGYNRTASRRAASGRLKATQSTARKFFNGQAPVSAKGQKMMNQANARASTMNRSQPGTRAAPAAARPQQGPTRQSIVPTANYTPRVPSTRAYAKGGMTKKGKCK